MALLSIIDENRTTADPGEIREYLLKAGISFERWELAPGLDENAEGDAVLAAYAERIRHVKEEGGYQKVDVIDVYPNTPGLDAMLSKFSTEHWHDEDEIRFILRGRGVYHVHVPSGPVVKLEVEPGDMIRVPRGTLHWFDLCATREIKAIRFFQDPAGWTPHYTESALERQYEPVCFGPNYVPFQGANSTSWLNSK